MNDQMHALKPIMYRITNTPFIIDHDQYLDAWFLENDETGDYIAQDCKLHNLHDVIRGDISPNQFEFDTPELAYEAWSTYNSELED